MTKKLTLLILGLLFFQAAKAQKDTVITYFKNTGRIVNNKDSADYERMILPPDSSINKDLYRVYEFYPNGKYKSVATSLTGPEKLTFDGTNISYFKNGVRRTVIQFKNGNVEGDVTNYYPNGKLYNIIKVDYFESWYATFANGVEMIECRDSTGNVLAAKGRGHFILFDEDFKTIVQEGNISDGKKEGEWRGIIADSGRYICTFHKNILKSGVSYIRSGNSYPFKQFYIQPQFDGGAEGFHEFLRKNMIYPEFAKQHHLTGSVLVSLTIKTDGSVADIKLVKGNAPCLNEVALRVMRLSPMWSPEIQYGIPVAVKDYVVSIDF